MVRRRMVIMPRRRVTRTRRQRTRAVAVQPVRRRRTRPRNFQRSRQPITRIGKTMRTIGGIAGGYFGNSGLGRNVAAGISRVFGQGDYVTNAPMQNSLMSGGPPAFSPLSSGFRIQHREFIQDVQSSVSFSSQIFRINPGLPDLFPWLSAVAVNFEEYKIHGMIVWLNSSSGMSIASTNTALGIWGAVTQYDASEADFTTKQQCENYVGAQSAVPSNSILHGIECKTGANVLGKYFVRTGDLASNLDIKFYDLGKVEVFTQGSQAVSTIGELWVSYDIEFSKPRLGALSNPSPVIPSNADFFTAVNVATDFPLGQGTVSPLAGNAGFVSLNQTTGNIEWNAAAPVGLYLVGVYILGVVTEECVMPDITWDGVTMIDAGNVLPDFNLPAQFPDVVPVPVSTLSFMYTFCADKQLADVGGFVNLDTSGSYPDSPSSIDVAVIYLGTAFSTRSKQERLTMSDYAFIKAFARRLIIRSSKIKGKCKLDALIDDDFQPDDDFDQVLDN